MDAGGPDKGKPPASCAIENKMMWPRRGPPLGSKEVVGEAHPPSPQSDSLKNRDFDFFGLSVRREYAGSTQLVELRRLVKSRHQRTRSQKVTAISKKYLNLQIFDVSVKFDVFL